jgi:hypothetical protein
LPASGVNQVWAYDFVFDACTNGQQLKCLTVIDEYTGECLAIDVARPHSFKPRDRGAEQAGQRPWCTEIPAVRQRFGKWYAENRQDSIVKVTKKLIYVCLSHESPLFNRIRVKEYDRMICGDLRESRKRWWKVRRTNQPAAPMSTSAFPVLSWATDDPKRWHDISAMTADVEGGRTAREAWRHRDPPADESISPQACAEVAKETACSRIEFDRACA